MAEVTVLSERRTSVDDIFDHLRKQIETLALKPGDRISEAEIEAQFGVSRQPVRDAFSRLANQDLLLIRPQRATEVRRFSVRTIEKARFIRAAVEKEVLVRAATHCDADGAARLAQSLDEQKEAVSKVDYEAFGQLDYGFHKILCSVAKADYAFDVILVEKSKIDRLCMLGHDREQRLPDLFEDHKAIARAVIDHDPSTAVETGMIHLSRLDETLERIKSSNASYFEQSGS